ncbi:hypothetical protein [Amaricoccus tamworthensis]|uniref:hypothetical protein n=1 Tax=Amaricoccus tamworthensis TaxID=57002 RepID=UPI003C7B57A8
MNVNGKNGSDHDDISDFELDLILRDEGDEPPAPSLRLINAVLADAAEVSAARAAAEAKPASTQPRPAGLFGRLSGLFAPLGGWQTATALTVCAFVGFAAGLSGGTDAASSLIFGETVALDFPSDTVTDYFDIALSEG